MWFQLNVESKKQITNQIKQNPNIFIDPESKLVVARRKRAGGAGWTQSRKKRKCYDNFFQSWHLRRAGFWSRGWAFWGQSLLGNLKTSLRALGSSQARQWCRRCVLRSSARPLVRGFMDFCLHSGFKPTWVNLRLADETLDETVRQKPHGGG